MKLVLNVTESVLNRNHPSQQDLVDFEEEADAAHGTSEYDWATIDTALDVLIGLAVVMKGDAAQVWKLFEKPILKLVVSDEDQQRSIAVGVVSEMIAYIGSAISPYTEKIMKNILRRLSDRDLETRSNAAYATGQLIFHSNASGIYLPNYPAILQKLESMLEITENRVRDNAAGCLCRMIMKHSDQVPLPEVVPALVGLLPLNGDYEENTPVYKCIFSLCKSCGPHLFFDLTAKYLTYRVADEQSDATIQSLTPQLIPVFGEVLSPPKDQLNDETRQLVRSLVAELYKAEPLLFASHLNVLQAAGLS